jgi:hypothetical protein
MSMKTLMMNMMILLHIIGIDQMLMIMMKNIMNMMIYIFTMIYMIIYLNVPNYGFCL